MIWLIGNKGMLGSEVEKLLIAGKLDYFATDNEVDITNIKSLETFIQTKDQPHWIINCAAYTAVEKAESEKETAFAINGMGPKNIAKIARNNSSKLIHISTDYVFDGSKDEAYTETDATHPLNVYGASKLEGEVNIQKTTNNYFILRTSWLFGKNGPNFVRTILRLFEEKNEIPVVSDQFGSPTYAPDLAKQIVEIIAQDSEQYGIYHITNEGRASWDTFAAAIYELASKHGLIDNEVMIKEVSTTEYPSKITRPLNSYLSKEKFKETFTSDIRDWKTALEDYILEIL